MIKEYNGMTIDKVNWVTGGYTPGSIGMIQITNEVGDKKIYIGVVDGHNEEADIIHILQHGGKFFAPAAENLYKHFHPDPDGDWKDVIKNIAGLFSQITYPNDPLMDGIQKPGSLNEVAAVEIFESMSTEQQQYFRSATAQTVRLICDKVLTDLRNLRQERSK